MESQLQQLETKAELLEQCAERLRLGAGRTQQDWLEMGSALADARDIYKEDDREFGDWCDQQPVGLDRVTLFQIRKAYEEYSAKLINPWRFNQ